MWPHRWQPTRLPRPWDSPGKNTGVGCHFPLQCMKVKSESEVAQSCPTLSDPMDCSLPGSSIHGIFQAGVLEWGAIAFSACFPLKTPKTSCYGVMPGHALFQGLHTMACKCTDDVHFVWECPVWFIGIRGILSIIGPGWLTPKSGEQKEWS